MRFANQQERPIEEQIQSLSTRERECFCNVKHMWESLECFDPITSRWVRVDRGYVFSDEMYLRFAQCNDFDQDAALSAMDQYDPRYLNMRCEVLEQQLLSKTLFVVPGLMTKEGYDVFYMRPSRFFPSETPTGDIIDNLVYCMQIMLEKEHSCIDGIAFVANMAGWTRENFSISYCHEFMKTLQGRRVPVKVRRFLIVDPPSWFGTIWTIMQQMLSADFCKRIHMIPASDLYKYLEPGYKMYLPDDMEGGRARTKDIVHDFLTYRTFIEGGSMENKRSSIANFFGNVG